jgi:histidinol-phosphate phosphatase family protein
VFLDRDNTLILNHGDLGDPGRVRLLPGVPEGLASLREAGFTLVVVTNQGGVARGRFTESDVLAVHQRLGQMLDRCVGREGVIARFYHCPFHPQGSVVEYTREHPWRKPAPGMLLQAAQDLSLDLGRSWLIGDAARDVEAGRRAGCRTVLLHPDDADRAEGLAQGREEEGAGSVAEGASPRPPTACGADFLACDLPQAAEIIRGEHSRGWRGR